MQFTSLLLRYEKLKTNFKEIHAAHTWEMVLDLDKFNVHRDYCNLQTAVQNVSRDSLLMTDATLTALESQLRQWQENLAKVTTTYTHKIRFLKLQKTLETIVETHSDTPQRHQESMAEDLRALNGLANFLKLTDQWDAKAIDRLDKYEAAITNWESTIRQAIIAASGKPSTLPGYVGEIVQRANATSRVFHSAPLERQRTILRPFAQEVVQRQGNSHLELQTVISTVLSHLKKPAAPRTGK